MRDGAAAACLLWQRGVGVGRERKPPDWAWQMYSRKPARALLIKHNEAWDHKIFHLILGPHEGGADWLGWQRRKAHRRALGLGWGTGRHQLGTVAPGLLFRVRGRLAPGLSSKLGQTRGKGFLSQGQPSPAGDLGPVTCTLGLSFPTGRGKGGRHLNRKAPEPPPALIVLPPSSKTLIFTFVHSKERLSKRRTQSVKLTKAGFLA